MESATGVNLHDENQQEKKEDCCDSCGQEFSGPPILVDNHMRICNQCAREIRQSIIFDEAKVNPYGSHNRLLQRHKA